MGAAKLRRRQLARRVRAQPHLLGTEADSFGIRGDPLHERFGRFHGAEGRPSTLDYGAIPTQDIPTIPSIKSEGYNVTPVPTWGFDFMMPNFANPAVGPVLNQLYIRQVFGHLMDQNTMIKHFMDGYGTPVYGPAPIYPLGNPFVTNVEKTNPYPYSVSTAESILKAHGWKVDPGGVDTCQTPGAGPRIVARV